MTVLEWDDLLIGWAADFEHPQLMNIIIGDAKDDNHGTFDERFVRIIEQRMESDVGRIEVTHASDLSVVESMAAGHIYWVGSMQCSISNRRGTCELYQIYVQQVRPAPSRGVTRVEFFIVGNGVPINPDTHITANVNTLKNNYMKGKHLNESVLFAETFAWMTLAHRLTDDKDPIGFTPLDFINSMGIDIIGEETERIIKSNHILTWVSPTMENLGERNYGDDTWDGSSVFKPDISSASPPQVGGEPINFVIYTDTRLPVRLNATGSRTNLPAYWIDQVRCTLCFQRVIVSLTEQQVPPPSLSLKCPTCLKKGLVIS
tara:strand:- start:26253 stop:27203 length:951 start_codon:yes stop_codon:yes gene_type:complete